MQPTRFMLRLNALTCLAFGLIFALFPNDVANFLGAFPPRILRILGVLLSFHAVHLIVGSLRPVLSKIEVYYFSMGDLGWYLGSLLILVSTDCITTAPGVWACLGVAAIVMVIGMSQLWTYSEATRSGVPPITFEKPRRSDDYLPQNYSRLKAIGVSWMGIKTWVKVWLTALNIVFLVAVFFWLTGFAKVTLASYVATMPLLLSIMIVERGLTRFLGIGHLITWVPLMIYIWMRLNGDIAGPQLIYSEAPNLVIYAWILFVFTGVCLAFDVYDLLRWARGERARLGSITEINKRVRLEVPT